MQGCEWPLRVRRRRSEHARASSPHPLLATVRSDILQAAILEPSCHVAEGPQPDLAHNRISSADFLRLVS